MPLNRTKRPIFEDAVMVCRTVIIAGEPKIDLVREDYIFLNI